MEPKQPFLFPPFRLDPGNGQLWCGQQILPLKPKTFAVLEHLVSHAGQLVTKEELLDALWADVHVSDAVLKTCVREIRQALQDNPKAPQYIETVHRRGYRFIAAVTRRQFSAVSHLIADGGTPAPISTSQPRVSTLVGREGELAQLHAWWVQALQGKRQVVFVTGEAGIGKTTIVEAFLERIATAEEVWIGRGHSIEHYGTGEAYLPVLEAFGRLGQESGGERLVELLNRHAPTWLVQMPALIDTARLETLQYKGLGATKERMLREMAEAVERLTQERPLVLQFEDLQWSDHATLDLLAYLARRPGPARLMVLGTYRPVDVAVRDHPLKPVKQELQVRGLCEELRLEFLPTAAVAEYVTRRFAVGTQPAWPVQQVAQLIHRRTEGNPLFMVSVVNDLVTQGVIAQRNGQWEMTGNIGELEVPAGVRQFIEQQIERISPAGQEVLETASAAGGEFLAATVAAGIEAPVEEVERTCEAFARQGQFLQGSGTGEWPDGTVAARYRFVHALYQEVLYERVSVGRRVSLHQRIGARQAEAYGNRSREIAAELAVHFERGRDYRRAAQYLQYAGENALRRNAHREAIDLLTQGLAVLQLLPPHADLFLQELALQIALGVPLVATKGYAAPEVAQVYDRARELCRQAGEAPHLFPALLGLYGFYLVRAELATARELGELSLVLAERAQDPALLMLAHGTLGNSLFFLGELRGAREHLERGIALYDVQQHHSYTLLYGNDPGIARLSYAAWVLWFLGYPDQALTRSREALTLAQELGHPFNLAFALCFAAWLHQVRREERATQERAESLMALSHEQGFPFWFAQGAFLRGWALVEQGHQREGLQQMRQGEAGYRTLGAKLGRSLHLALLGEAYGKARQTEEGFEVLTEALTTVQESEERYYEAELWRLKGELLLAQAGSKLQAVGCRAKSEEAEACFHHAIAIARRQSAKSLELRAIMSLSRLWQQQGKKGDARTILTESYRWFTEGFDTRDIREARALLTELS